MNISRNVWFALAVVLVLQLGCKTALEDRRDGAPEAGESFTLKWIGKMMTVHLEGDASPKGDLNELANKPGGFAIGPLAGLRGEITALDGKVHVARVRDRKEAISTDWNQQAPFLVYGQVHAWTEVETPSRSMSLPEIEQWLPEAAARHGLDPSVPFPFKIKAPSPVIEYHIIDNQAPGYQTTLPHAELMRHFKLEAGSATLLGVYSTQHAGIFTHHGSSTHVHMISGDERHSGHVDSLTTGERWTLYLPKR